MIKNHEIVFAAIFLLMVFSHFYDKLCSFQVDGQHLSNSRNKYVNLSTIEIYFVFGVVHCSVLSVLGL